MAARTRSMNSAMLAGATTTSSLYSALPRWRCACRIAAASRPGAFNWIPISTTCESGSSTKQNGITPDTLSGVSPTSSRSSARIWAWRSTLDVPWMPPVSTPPEGASSHIPAPSVVNRARRPNRRPSAQCNTADTATGRTPSSANKPGRCLWAMKRRYSTAYPVIRAAPVSDADKMRPLNSVFPRRSCSASQRRSTSAARPAVKADASPSTSTTTAGDKACTASAMVPTILADTILSQLVGRPS